MKKTNKAKAKVMYARIEDGDKVDIDGFSGATFYNALSEANKNATEGDILVRLSIEVVGKYKTQLVEETK